MYSYTLLFLAVSYTTKNHWIQLDGLSRMILAFNLLVVIIFKILTGKAGSNWWLGKNLILTFQTFVLISWSSDIGQGCSTVGWGRTFI
jgi:hypothetical protein